MNKMIGVLDSQDNTAARSDYLFRISLKALILNDHGQVLVVKESGRDWWDLPGGGMDHGDGIKSALARELKEEVNLTEDFDYTVISVTEPKKLRRISAYQLGLVFYLTTNQKVFTPGEDGDEVAFIHPEDFRASDVEYQRQIAQYAELVISTARETKR